MMYRWNWHAIFWRTFLWLSALMVIWIFWMMIHSVEVERQAVAYNMPQVKRKPENDGRISKYTIEYISLPDGRECVFVSRGRLGGLHCE